MIIYTKKPTSDLTESEILEISALCYESRDAANESIDQWVFRKMAESYKNRDGCYIVFGRDSDDSSIMVNCLFILNLEESTVSKDPDFLKLVDERGFDFKKECFVTALMYVHPDYRGLGYGRELLNTTHAYAKEVGYKYLMGFGSMNRNSYNFYDHVFPEDEITDCPDNVSKVTDIMTIRYL